ncbi:MAG TPA: tail fiber domain-containing protein [Thermoanaerobaculia bacterium]|nr:tail fiber domain-containing protein [Thermoanaerobaculia bacterium]
MRSIHRFSLPLLIAAAAALLPLIAFAGNAEHQPARLIATARAIEWRPAIDAAGALLSLQRPDGDVITETFAAGRNPMLRLDGMADGIYAYELRFAQADSAPLVQSGSFMVANGAIVRPDAIEHLSLRTPLHPEPQPFYADFVSAAGGVCAGADCTSTESFGLATAKLKANNTRLKFEDTSTSVGFPTTDWQLSANDTFSGGLNKFFVEDLTAATVPLLIEGGTPTNALYLDSTGRIGLGTSTPARNLSISDSISPTIRMEQSASPFQAWDIVANNNNFYVRDINHEFNPFIIRSSTPDNTLVLDSTGRLGLGVSAPLYQIHHSSGARLDAGNWVNASSRAVKQDIHQLDGDAALSALKALEPVTFAYKANPAEMNVGFIAEDVPDLVATADRKGLSAMDIAAVLTKVIQGQQRTIEDLQTRLQRLERKEQ